MIRKAVTLFVAALALNLMPFNASAQNSEEGYWKSAPGGAFWKNPFGMCWRAGYWTPAMANAECDPDLVPKPAAAPAAPPPPPPAMQHQAMAAHHMTHRHWARRHWPVRLATSYCGTSDHPCSVQHIVVPID